jgi:UDP-N-acetylmuramate: L-alanyl-gamma-D-glutamyl-meso-diaminopimelate ligase
VIVNGRDTALARVLERGVWSEVERFGSDDEWHWRALPGDDEAFEVRHGGRSLGTLRLGLAGDHNRSNAVAAVAAAAHAGVDAEQSLSALACFGGVRRRLERCGIVRQVSVYDDFAHHPTAIAATLSGLRRRVGSERILALLEPRSNTMRLGVMQDRLAPSLKDADLVFCYGPREGKHALGWDPAQALRPLGPRARVFDRIEDLVAAVAASARPCDHVVAMSNGGFGGVHGKLLAALAATGGAHEGAA